MKTIRFETVNELAKFIHLRPYIRNLDTGKIYVDDYNDSNSRIFKLQNIFSGATTKLDDKNNSRYFTARKYGYKYSWFIHQVIDLRLYIKTNIVINDNKVLILGNYNILLTNDSKYNRRTTKIKLRI